MEILVRPESLRIEPAVARASGTAMIRAVAAEGALARWTVEFGDGCQLQAHDLARHGWRVGEPVRVTVADGAVMLLPTKIQGEKREDAD